MELLISSHSLDTGELSSARFSLGAPVTLGRGTESAMPLDGTGISREHFRLHSDGDRIFVTDLSSNGTWLNARRLTRAEPEPLTPADIIRIPGFEIRIALPEAVGKPDTGSTREPARAGGSLEFVRRFLASLSLLERVLIALAMATLALVVTFLST